MRKDAITHRPRSEYAFGLDGDTTVFRLRCALGDLASCTLWYADTASPETPVPFLSTPMRRVLRGEHCDWWEAELRHTFHRLYYYFELCDGAETAFFSGDVFMDAPSAERAEYFKFSFNHRADIARVPDWAYDAVVYNIFPDSFASGRRALSCASGEQSAGGAVSHSRLGGTLAGIRGNLDHIAELGADCLYLNPVFAAGGYHNYDTIDYLHVDPNLGTDGDLRALVSACHERGMRIILDGVFNHCGAQFFAFRDVLEKQESSRYRDWFYRLSFPVRLPEAGEEPSYECFSRVGTMPKLDTANAEVREYLCRVGEHWLREYGADGWRLDVADETDGEFWREFRRRCKAVNPQALLMGEVWGDARRWLDGDMFDSAMNYDFRSHCRHFFAEGSIDAAAFAGRCGDMLMRYKRQIAAVQLNILDSHDVSRFLDLCGGDTRRLRLAVIFMCCFPGIPCVFYGDELGVTGREEYEYRRAMPWQSGSRELFEFYRAALALRRGHPALRRGEMHFLRAERGERLLVFERRAPGDSLTIAINASDTAAELPGGALPPLSWKIL